MPPVRKTPEDLPPISRSRIDEIKAIPDANIDYSDIPELSADFWEHADIHTPSDNKAAISLRIEAEVLDWFKGQGRGHTTRMAAVLRHFYEHHHKDTPTSP